MLWVKSLHIFFVVAWFAGLFYLPRIYVNLAMLTPASPAAERERLLTMAGKLYRFSGPLMIGTFVFGLWLWLGYGLGRGSGWMHAKLTLVLVLAGYHGYCGRLLKQFRAGTANRSHVWFRFFNEAPVLILLAIIVLVVVKPF